MNDPFAPRVGGILSADIAVPEHEREVRFYATILGTGENPLWQEDLMNNQGMPIIGLGERIPEYEALPLQWMPHILVADVAGSAERALALGGSELMHGKDDEGRSQWAVLVDPQGAAFGIIPVVSAEAASPTEVASSGVGHIAGISLTVSDAAASRDFYRQVVGWTVQDVEMKDENGDYVDYCMLGGDGKPAAAICRARGLNLDLPPVWLLDLPVGDLAESLRRVQGEGGKIIKERQGAEGEPVSAVVQDPVGAYVTVREAVAVPDTMRP